MKSYNDCSEYITPRERQSSPSSSGRQSWHSNSSNWSSSSARIAGLARYNGNYEGDYSMFSEHSPVTPRLRKLANESSSENDEMLEKYGTVRSQPSAMMRHFAFCKEKLFASSPYEQAAAKIESICGSFLYRKLSVLFCLLLNVMLWLFQQILKISVRLSNRSFLIWKGRSILRRIARHLLWCLTLAKGSDTKLYLLIIVITPILFIFAVIGLTLALYCICKSTIRRWIFNVRIMMY